jgi:tRNA A-37 threonylcarbamoyl transferase component Bud32
VDNFEKNMKEEDKVISKARLLDNYMYNSTDGTLRKDKKLLEDKYREIEPDFKKRGDPYVHEVFPGKMTKMLQQVKGIEEFKLSECPALSEIHNCDVKFGRASTEKYINIMTLYNLEDKLL